MTKKKENEHMGSDTENGARIHKNKKRKRKQEKLANDHIEEVKDLDAKKSEVKKKKVRKENSLSVEKHVNTYSDMLGNVSIQMKNDDKESTKRKRDMMDENVNNLTEQVIKKKKKRKHEKRGENVEESEETETHLETNVQNVKTKNKLDRESKQVLGKNKPEVTSTNKTKAKSRKSKKKKKPEDNAEKDAKSVKVAQDSSLQYLKLWSENRNQWKFQKVRQTWLLKHCYNKEQISDEYFSILLEYLEGLKGRSREITVENAEKLIQKYEDSDSSDDDDVKCERARQIIQLLS